MQSHASEHMSDLDHRLKSQDEPTRQQAQVDLRVLMADALRLLRRRRRILLGTRILWALFAIFSCVYDGFYRRFKIEYFAFGVAGFVMELTVSWLQRRTVRPLIALDVPQAVGPLMDVLVNSPAGFVPSREITAALIRLLPRLQSSDANLLLPRQRQALNWVLRTEAYWKSGFYDANLIVAILRALEQIGDKTSLPSVDTLARSGENRQVRSAARQCLPFLQQQTDLSGVEHTLLRASAPNSSPEQLLRSAGNGTEADPQRLLRASTVDEPSQQDAVTDFIGSAPE